MSKAPAFQFYPGDWLRDTALRSCSVCARGLWIDMLCIMHQGQPYGHLTINGKPVEPTTLARMVGESQKRVESWLAELQEAKVYQMDDQGIVFSKRMVKDEATRKARAEGGKLGGNPQLKDNRKVESKDNLPVNLQPTPSSSSSFASSSSSSASAETSPNGDVVPTQKTPFAPPTVDDVRTYCQSRGSAVDPEQFVDHYTANGWVQGKGKPLKDWKAAVRTWERNEFNKPAPARPIDRVATKADAKNYNPHGAPPE